MITFSLIILQHPRYKTKNSTKEFSVVNLGKPVFATSGGGMELKEGSYWNVSLSFEQEESESQISLFQK
jgi:hypothetical protein